MARKIIHTNPHLKTKKDRIEQVARSQAVSHKIEGIRIEPKRIKSILKKRENSPSGNGK